MHLDPTCLSRLHSVISSDVLSCNSLHDSAVTKSPSEKSPQILFVCLFKLIDWPMKQLNNVLWSCLGLHAWGMHGLHSCCHGRRLALLGLNLWRRLHTTCMDCPSGFHHHTSLETPLNGYHHRLGLPILFCWIELFMVIEMF